MGKFGPQPGEVRRGAHWRGLRFEAEDAIADGRVTAKSLRVLDRWLVRTKDRAGDVITAEEALSVFAGTVSQQPIMVLIQTLRAIAPQHPHLPALSLALLMRRRAYRPAKPRATPPPALRVSVEADVLPEAWQEVLRDMRAGCRRRCRAPQAPIVDRIEHTLRQLAFAAEVEGLTVELSIPALAALVRAMLARDLASSTIGIALSMLHRFAAYSGAPETILHALAKEARSHRRQAAKAGKHKERFLHQSGLTLEDVARTALALYEAAHVEVDAPERHLNWMRAALFAVVFCRPLRPLDVRKLVIGQHLQRDSEGWALFVRTRKNQYKIVGRLWDIVTPFLDGAILLGADEKHLWTMYERAQGRPFLASRDGAALHPGWATTQSRCYLGIGIGILRTLWHDHCAATGEARAVEAALALCGQHDPRTAQYYRTQASARSLVAQAQQLLGAIADGAIVDNARER